MVTVAAVLAAACQAQVSQPPGNRLGRHFPFPPRQGVSTPPAAAPGPEVQGQPSIHTGAVTSAPNAPQPAAAPNLPPSLQDKPAVPAQVTLRDGSLSVDARNSSLSDILKNVEGSSGMTVDGFGKDSRIFGVYGPGPPRDVLAELLDGAGYNFLMVGSGSKGTPREIVLTARSNAPLSPPSPGINSQQEEEDEAPNYPPPQVVEPPPPPAPVMPPQQQQRPRTPQEMLQELQRLREQQQQQQQGQPPQ